jgi:hypothetical protein
MIKKYKSKKNDKYKYKIILKSYFDWFYLVISIIENTFEKAPKRIKLDKLLDLIYWYV